MNYSEFDMAIDSFNGEAVHVVPFISKVCNVSHDIATMLHHNNKHKEDGNKRIFNSLPVLNKRSLKRFNDFKLKVNIQFTYG